MSPDADGPAVPMAGDQPDRPAIEIGPAPDPDPTRRWAMTTILVGIGLVVAVRRVLR